MYQLNTNDGYIVSVVKGVTNGNITEERYNEIMAAIESRPEALKGYYYRLKEDLTWELCELPPVEPEPEEQEAEIADYEASLERLGVEI